jgi:uncharacterized repeat protein (TIGR03803 family)
MPISFPSRTGSVFLVAGMLVVMGATSASASTYKVLYSFCAKTDCADGLGPQAGLVMDASGNLYGTTQSGGGGGTVFELTPNASRTKWKYKRLYSFCAKKHCADGLDPGGRLILDSSGNLYGTAAGGKSDSGTVFELMPNADRSKWSIKNLYSFCPRGENGCTDGQGPIGSLAYVGAAPGALYDGVSPLYGVTYSGGTFVNQNGYGEGTAFALSPDTGTGRWKEKVIYDFCQNADCSTKLPQPSSALTADAAGNLYGTADQDGFNGNLFELSPKARSGAWAETTLYSFCSQQSCADGEAPEADTVLLDSEGNLYGTTLEGGSGFEGVMYAFSPQQSKLSVLYSFCTQANCADGGVPRAGVIKDSSGNLFGTTTDDGFGAGTVYELTGGSLHTLYTFCSQTGCADGSDPKASLIMDASGNLYGTTSEGGAHQGGTVFEVTP